MRRVAMEVTSVLEQARPEEVVGFHLEHVID